MAKERKRERINPTISPQVLLLRPKSVLRAFCNWPKRPLAPKSASKIPIIGDSPSDGGIIVHTHPKISTRIF